MRKRIGIEQPLSREHTYGSPIDRVYAFFGVRRILRRPRPHWRTLPPFTTA